MSELRNLLQERRLFVVSDEAVKNGVLLYLGKPLNDARWFAFVQAVLINQKHNECQFLRVYSIHDNKLVSAWEIVIYDVEKALKLIDDLTKRPKWMEDFKVELSEGKMKVSLVGEPWDPPDPSVVLRNVMQGRSWSKE